MKQETPSKKNGSKANADASTPRTWRLLCTADIHVGRRPTRLGPGRDSAGVSCAAMLANIAAYAIKERVDAVLIAGDIVDQDNKFHEAYGPVERALKQLTASGIDVYAVAGNHDFDVLPRLADALGDVRFHLLGRGGMWETATLERAGLPSIAIRGWSFPTESVPFNPMATFPSSTDLAMPTIGLLHADLDQMQSLYAPVSLRDLQSAPVGAWVLGHIHRPRLLDAANSPSVLYPGSPQAMDPGETGVHGCWLMELGQDGRIRFSQTPMSAIQYESFDLDISALNSIDDLDASVPRLIKDRVGQACRDRQSLQLCVARLRLTGQSLLHKKLNSWIKEFAEQSDLDLDGLPIRIDCVSNDTRPPIDLPALSRGSSVVSDLAKLLMELSGGQSGEIDHIKAMVQETADLGYGLCNAVAYQPLNERDYPPPTHAEVRSAMLKQGMTLLESLLSQKPSLEIAEVGG